MSIPLKEEIVDYDAATGRMRSGPRHVYVELSSRCNLACVHCPKDFGADLDHPQLDMPYEVVERIGPWLRDARFVNLNSVGEALLSPDFDRTIDVCAEGSAEVSFNTNGLLLSARRCARLVERRVHSVTISIDGMESNQPIRGVDYRSVRDRLLALDAAKRAAGAELPHIAVAFTFMKRNALEMPRLLRDLLPRARVHAVHVQPLVIYYETLRDENPYRCVTAGDAIEAAREVAGRHGTELHVFRSTSDEDERNRADSRRHLGQYSPRFGCIDPFFEIKVRSTGEVMACSYGLLPGLDVREHDLDAIWNHPWYRSLRRRLHAGEFEGRCATCPYVHGSPEHQEDPLRVGVHHSQAARFLRGGYGARGRKQPPPTGRRFFDELL